MLNVKPISNFGASAILNPFRYLRPQSQFLTWLLASLGIIILLAFALTVAYIFDNPAGTSERSRPVGAALGRELADFHCEGCHSPRMGQSIGPSWRGLYGRAELMEDGYLIRVDEEYLRESIQNPSAQTVKGYITGSMHSDFQFNEEELSAIIAYIKTL